MELDWTLPDAIPVEQPTLVPPPPPRRSRRMRPDPCFEYDRTTTRAPPDPAIIDKTRGTWLSTTKLPVLDALACCALKGWGVSLEGDESFIFHDFNDYALCSAAICPKSMPTSDIRNRLKALRRWCAAHGLLALSHSHRFPDFPALAEAASGKPFVIRAVGTCAVHVRRSVARVAWSQKEHETMVQRATVDYIE